MSETQKSALGLVKSDTRSMVWPLFTMGGAVIAVLVVILNFTFAIDYQEYSGTARLFHVAVTYPLLFIQFLLLLFDVTQHYAVARLRPHRPTTSKQAHNTFHNVTIVSCSLGGASNYVRSVRSWLESNPKEIIVVTIENKINAMHDTLSIFGNSRITVTSIPKAGVRHQLLEGIKQTSTDFVVFSDDRVIWGPETLNYLVCGFHDDSIGAVSVPQKVQSSVLGSDNLTIWESFGALNLVRRNMLHCSLAYFNDGQVMNLSGRTVAYRTHILKDALFQHAFMNDLWRGKYLLKTGDDSFITGWLYANDWKTCMQKHDAAIITAGVNSDWTYLKQLLRWSRDAGRQYSRELGFAVRSRKYRHIKRSFLNLVSNYATDISVLLSLGAFIFEAIAQPDQSKSRSLRSMVMDHIAISSSLTILEHAHFFNSWHRMLYAPVVVVYMYVHAFVVLYALFTLDETTWGSRKV